MNTLRVYEKINLGLTTKSLLLFFFVSNREIILAIICSISQLSLAARRPISGGGGIDIGDEGVDNITTNFYLLILPLILLFLNIFVK